jgi:hypothetical protein
MLTTVRLRRACLAWCVLSIAPALGLAQRSSGPNPFPGGTNPDGSLRPTPPVTRLFTQDAYTKSVNGDLVFERTLHGLRNTVLLPAGWEVAAVSQSGTLGMYQGRAFVALINLNAENNYKVAIRARKRS